MTTVLLLLWLWRLSYYNEDFPQTPCTESHGIFFSPRISWVNPHHALYLWSAHVCLCEQLGVIGMYIFWFSCWFSHLVLLADPIKLPLCIKGENKPPLSRLTRPASLQFITNAPLPASCVVRVQMWNRAEVTNPVHLTASTHCLTIHSSESCVWGAW